MAASQPLTYMAESLISSTTSAGATYTVGAIVYMNIGNPNIVYGDYVDWLTSTTITTNRVLLFDWPSGTFRYWSIISSFYYPYSVNSVTVYGTESVETYTVSINNSGSSLGVISTYPYAVNRIYSTDTEYSATYGVYDGVNARGITDASITIGWTITSSGQLSKRATINAPSSNPYNVSYRLASSDHLPCGTIVLYY